MDLADPLHLVLHGGITLVGTLCAGFLYGRQIGATPHDSEKERAWKLVHVAGTMGGMALLVVASVEPLITVSPTWLAWLNGLLLTSNWTFMVGMVLAALAGVRGLDPGANPANNTVLGLYTVAVTTGIGAAVLLSLAAALSLMG